MPRGGFQGIASRHSDLHRRGRAWDPFVLMKEPLPSGENHEGWVESWNPNTQRKELRPPHIVCGAGALDASTGNIALTNNAWVALYTAIPGDGLGMRGGLVGYLPKGRWKLTGRVTIATPTAGVEYHVRIRQGTTESNPVTQPKIIGGNPITLVGGGLNTSHSTANKPFEIHFHCSDIQCDMAWGYANEVWVEVYAENAASGAGAALASHTQSGNGTISQCTFMKKDGLYGTS